MNDREKKRCFSMIFLIIVTISCFLFCGDCMTVKAAPNISCVLLSSYEKVIDIGEECYIFAWTSNGKKPTWKSSNSKVASVNTYGLVTGKRAGTAKITAKISGAEMSCRVKVNKMMITINKKSLSLERNDSVTLQASASNHAQLLWKSSKKSIAEVDEKGCITARKPGETIITVSADNTSVSCRVTVRQPKVVLNKTSITLYRGQTEKLTASVSSGITPTWRTNKKSVAIIDENGVVTAVKHGMAVITAKVDGISKICQVTVEQPEIVLSDSELNLKVGQTRQVSAKVSSGNSVVWTVSKQSVADVDKNGKVTAYAKGTCYIYATEDGVKERCRVCVTEE